MITEALGAVYHRALSWSKSNCYVKNSVFFFELPSAKQFLLSMNSTHHWQFAYEVLCLNNDGVEVKKKYVFNFPYEGPGEISSVDSSVCVLKRRITVSNPGCNVWSKALRRWLWEMRSQGFAQKGHILLADVQTHSFLALADITCNPPCAESERA